jgi:hypothetical protein
MAMFAVFSIMAICFVLPGYITLLIPQAIEITKTKYQIVIILLLYIISIFVIPLISLQKIFDFEIGDQFSSGIIAAMIVVHFMEFMYLKLPKKISYKWKHL